MTPAVDPSASASPIAREEPSEGTKGSTPSRILAGDSVASDSCSGIVLLDKELAACCKALCPAVSSGPVEAFDDVPKQSGDANPEEHDFHSDGKGEEAFQEKPPNALHAQLQSIEKEWQQFKTAFDAEARARMQLRRLWDAKANDASMMQDKLKAHAKASSELNDATKQLQKTHAKLERDIRSYINRRKAEADEELGDCRREMERCRTAIDNRSEKLRKQCAQGRDLLSHVTRVLEGKHEAERLQSILDENEQKRTELKRSIHDTRNTISRSRRRR